MVYNETNYLSGLGAVERNGKLYTFDVHLACLIEIDLATFAHKIIYQMKDIESKDSICVIDLFLVGEELLLVLRDEYVIISYNLYDKHSCRYAMSQVEGHNELIVKSLFIEEMIWMFPKCTSDDIVVFDVINQKFRKIGRMFDSICNLSEKFPREVLFRYNVFNLDNKVLFSGLETNFLLVYDVHKLVSQIYRLGKEDDEAYVLECEKDYYWISDKESRKLSKWNFESGIVDSYSIQSLENDNGIMKIFTKDNLVLLIPYYGNYYIIMDTDTCTENKIEYPGGFKRVELTSDHWRLNYLCSFRGGKYEYVIPQTVNMILRIKNKDLILDCKEIQYSSAEMGTYYAKTKKIIKEKKGFDLENFLVYIKNFNF